MVVNISELLVTYPPQFHLKAQTCNTSQCLSIAALQTKGTLAAVEGTFERPLHR